MRNPEYERERPLFEPDPRTLASRHQEAVEQIHAFQGEGWVWSETTANMLVSPYDQQIYVWYNRSTGNLLYSPKLVAMMEELLREEQDNQRT